MKTLLNLMCLCKLSVVRLADLTKQIGFASVADLHRLTIKFGSVLTNGYAEGGSSAKHPFASANLVFCSLY